MCKILKVNKRIKEGKKFYLLEKAQKGFPVKGARMLSTIMLTEEDVIGIGRKLIMVWSRAKYKIPKFYSTLHLAALNRSYPLSNL
jgi:hypothetical protein